jgi:SAM-dependent methyltransferase
MDAAEYENLARVEREHWYYSGKREIVRYWIEQVRAPASTDHLLDCGAGTGLFAAEMAAHCQVRVLDTHDESLRILRQRFRPEQVIALETERVPLADTSLDYVTALDVLEHVPDDAAVVRDFARLLKPGGIAAVTVPVGMELWSDWDETLQHYRRYRRAELCALFPSDTWEIVHVNHTNVVVYPAVWLIRRWRAMGKHFGWARSRTRTEDRMPPAWLNRLLRYTFSRLGRSRVKFPFGVSLVLLARRRG